MTGIEGATTSRAMCPTSGRKRRLSQYESYISPFGQLIVQIILKVWSSVLLLLCICGLAEYQAQVRGWNSATRRAYKLVNKYNALRTRRLSRLAKY